MPRAMQLDRADVVPWVAATTRIEPSTSTARSFAVTQPSFASTRPSMSRSTRRTFLGQSLVGSAAVAAGLLGGLGMQPLFAREPARAVPGAKKKILILGGTGFIGPKTVEAALARGHEVTVFNRGRTEKRIPFGFEGVTHLYGNRDPNLPADDTRGPDGKLLTPDASPKGLEQLSGKSWDVVIDNSGYYPRMVKASAELLAKSCSHYIFISSISAYADNSVENGDEDRPLAQLADPTVETMGNGGEFYGGLKTLCEQAAQAAFPGKCTVVRPGYIVGPGDPTDRFTYWPVRISKGGAIAVPGSPSDPMQWIDARDLADFLVTLVENATTGVFNACGPADLARFGDVVASCMQLTPKGSCDVAWIPADFLAKAGIPEGTFPIWSPPVGNELGFHTWSNDRAEKAGLRFRPLDDTLKATLAWWPTEVERRRRVGAQLVADAAAKGQPAPQLPDPELLRTGPGAAKEAELIAAWKAEQAGRKG